MVTFKKVMMEELHSEGKWWQTAYKASAIGRRIGVS